MAIKNDLPEAAATQATAAPKQSQPQVKQTMQQPQAQPQQGKWSFHNAFSRAPIGRGIGSETLTRLQTALAELYKQANPEVEMTLIPIDNTSETALAYSALVVCMRYKNTPELGVSYHTLIVEATGEKIATKFETINGTQVEIFRVAGDAADAILVNKVAERVRAAFPQSAIFAAEVCVVPRAFDTENKVSVHQLALNAGLAVSTELDVRQAGFQDINLAASAHDSNLVVQMSFARQQMENAVSEPIRSDLLLSFTSQQQQQQQNLSINSGDRTARIAELSAFIDLVWAPTATQGGMYNPYVVQQPQQAQKYAARMVITDMHSTFAQTPPAQLLALVTALSVRDDNNWIQAFRPTPIAGSEIDMHDIGAIGIEANFENSPTGFGARINTKADSFRPENLGQLVGAMIQPGLVISLDVPECGPETWCSSLFPAAANGSVEATEAIYNAANQLTNGNFSKYFGLGAPIFTDLGNRIHTGYYIDRNSVKRDIRDIDYLAVMNVVGERDPQAIRDWSDTFTRVQYPIAQRLAARKRTIMALTGQSAEFTGFAQRVTFTQAFMDALAKSCKDAGLNIRINTPLNSGEFNNERGVAGFVGSAIMQSGGSSVFNRDFGTPMAAAAGYFQNSSRWTR